MAIQVTYVLEDVVLKCERNEGSWSGTSTDTMTDTVVTFGGMSDQVLGAILFLATTGGEGSNEMVTEMYALVRPITKDWPSECLPFP